MIVITGMRELRSAWRTITVLSCSPFDLAVRTKSWPTTSVIVVRVYRASTALMGIARAITGRARWCSESTGSSRIETRPCEGNQPSSAAKIQSRMIPLTKLGTPTATIV